MLTNGFKALKINGGVKAHQMYAVKNPHCNRIKTQENAPSFLLYEITDETLVDFKFIKEV